MLKIMKQFPLKLKVFYFRFLARTSAYHKIISTLYVPFILDKEQLIRYKFRWAEADDEPQDNQLHIDEFKAFRHPEQSRNMLTKMVQDILDNLGPYQKSLLVFNFQPKKQ